MAHTQAIQTFLSKSVGSYYHVSRCTSVQESPQKASTGMTCPRRSSRGDNQILCSQREVSQRTEVVKESSERGKHPVGAGLQSEGQAGLLGTLSTLFLQLPLLL